MKLLQLLSFPFILGPGNDVMVPVFILSGWEEADYLQQRETSFRHCLKMFSFVLAAYEATT